MVQDRHTKDVFREMDGFLVLMSVLAGIWDANALVVEPEPQLLYEVTEGTRLVFENMSEAMHEHPENAEYFRVSCMQRHF